MVADVGDDIMNSGRSDPSSGAVIKLDERRRPAGNKLEGIEDWLYVQEGTVRLEFV